MSPTTNRGTGLFLSAIACMALATGSARAVLLVLDFNDLNVAGINGQGGGTGFSGTYTGSANSAIIASNLTSSLYNMPQSGNARAFRGANTNGLRQSFRTVTTSPVGEVWFSFLVETSTSASGASYETAGISLNSPSTATPFDNTGNVYAYMTGNDLYYSFGAGTAASVNITPRPADTAVDTLTLIVGQFIIGGSGAADTVNLWANPNLTANPDIFSYSTVYSSSAVNFLDSITTLGLVGHQVGTLGGGVIDNVRFSDGGGNAAQAFFDVTGVPEPSGLALALLGAGGFLARRRR
ncbi:MAG: PEP-CTERM sorting domain-containing protein [Akkermansiaceae bacterium]|nr:PEP-CTERM sorting domain-containing protein [Akkermansiaceae bacterium]